MRAPITLRENFTEEIREDDRARKISSRLSFTVEEKEKENARKRNARQRERIRIEQLRRLKGKTGNASILSGKIIIIIIS